MVDVSEQCGYTIVQQAALFHSIKALFSNKPILIVCNKIDTRWEVWMGVWMEVWDLTIAC